MLKLLATATLGLGMAVGAAGPAMAQAPLAAFFGSWTATALTDDADRQFLGVQPDDLAVTIEQDGDGFTMRWTSFRAVGEPTQPDIRRVSEEVTFEAADRAGLFQDEDPGNPMEGETLNWARLHDGVLTTYQVTVQEDGSYALVSCDRTASGDALQVDLRLISGGAPIRHVTGQLGRSGG